LIEVKGLTKRYGQHVAVNGITFSVSKGEVLGFLGPNGAGKSTTMNIVTGYLSPTAGSVSVGGHDVLKEPMEVKKLIGYMPEVPPLHPEMTVYQYLDFVGQLMKVGRPERKRSLEGILERVGIADMRGRVIKNLSKGYRQRVGLAQALVGSPAVLILDEPTIGLDPKQIIEIRNLIKELGREHTVILSSHILPEVTMVCERVVIIHKGSIVASDTIDNLSRKLAGSFRLALRLEGSERDALRMLRGLPEVCRVDSLGPREPGTFDLVVEAHRDRDIRKPVSTALGRAGIPIFMLKSVDLTLEEIFIQLTTEEGIGRGEVRP
jgi:ABC-2 type transport system ATP-binding protein